MRGPAQTEAAKDKRVAAVSRILGRPVEGVQRLASGRYTARIPHLGEGVNERIRALGVKVEDIPTETGGRRDDVRRVEFDPDAPIWRLLAVSTIARRCAFVGFLVACCLFAGVRLYK